MAAKKSNIGGAVGSVFTVVAVVVVVYFGYRLLKPAAAQAATSPGGIYGNGGYDPYNPYSQPNTGGGLLSSLLSMLGLGGGSSGGRGGGLSSGAGAGSGASYGGNSKPSAASYSAGSPMADVYNSIVEGLYGNGQIDGSESNPDLGGYSLQNYEPVYSDGGYQIPNMPDPSSGVDQNQFLNVQNFDPGSVPTYGGDSGGDDGGYGPDDGD